MKQALLQCIGPFKRGETHGMGRATKAAAGFFSLLEKLTAHLSLEKEAGKRCAPLARKPQQGLQAHSKREGLIPKKKKEKEAPAVAVVSTLVAAQLASKKTNANAIKSGASALDGKQMPAKEKTDLNASKGLATNLRSLPTTTSKIEIDSDFEKGLPLRADKGDRHILQLDVMENENVNASKGLTADPRSLPATTSKDETDSNLDKGLPFRSDKGSRRMLQPDAAENGTGKKANALAQLEMAETSPRPVCQLLKPEHLAFSEKISAFLGGEKNISAPQQPAFGEMLAGQWQDQASMSAGRKVLAAPFMPSDVMAQHEAKGLIEASVRAALGGRKQKVQPTRVFAKPPTNEKNEPLPTGNGVRKSELSLPEVQPTKQHIAKGLEHLEMVAAAFPEHEQTSFLNDSGGASVLGQNEQIKAPAWASGALHGPAHLSASARSSSSTARSAFAPAQAMEQIALGARAGQHSIELQLDPPHLGRLQARISLDREQHVHVWVHVQDAQARMLIEGQLPALRHALAEQGLQLGSFAFADHQGGNGRAFAEASISSLAPMAAEDASDETSGGLKKKNGLDVHV